LEGIVVPSPNCPEPFHPQHRAVPSDIAAQEWLSPALISVAIPPAGGSIVVVVVEEVVVVVVVEAAVVEVDVVDVNVVVGPTGPASPGPVTHPPLSVTTTVSAAAPMNLTRR